MIFSEKEVAANREKYKDLMHQAEQHRLVSQALAEPNSYRESFYRTALSTSTHYMSRMMHQTAGAVRTAFDRIYQPACEAC